jgi:hypothetical protein
MFAALWTVNVHRVATKPSKRHTFDITPAMRGNVDGVAARCAEAQPDPLLLQF